MLDPTAETRRKTYKRLYRLFDRATPLPVDCGAVCGKACCAGDEKTGMLLFPGEETSLPVFESEAGRILMRDPECAAFLQKLGDEQNELRTLGTLLQDGKQTE